jgi:Flp pilus assembly pilin Flp
MPRILLNFYEKGRAFIRSANGATAIEYALIASSIGVGLMMVFFMTGNNLGSLWSKVFNGLSSYLTVY